MTTIHAKQLTTFKVTEDGTSVAIGVSDEEGRAGALVLPAECLGALMMTLPEMARQAIRLQHRDPSLRLVYPLAGWEVERATQPGTFIGTLRTPDGFDVSFAMQAKDLREIGGAASGGDCDGGSGPHGNHLMH